MIHHQKLHILFDFFLTLCKRKEVCTCNFLYYQACSRSERTLLQYNTNILSNILERAICRLMDDVFKYVFKKKYLSTQCGRILSSSSFLCAKTKKLRKFRLPGIRHLHNQVKNAQLYQTPNNIYFGLDILNIIIYTEK